LAFAQGAGLAMRGHNLLWQNAKWLPNWVNGYDFGANPAKSAEALLTEHIRAEIGHYANHIHSWDVVNETIDQHTGLMRQTVLTKALGDRVIDFAYHTARAAAPDAQLVYNDYMSWGQGDAAHRSGVLRLLERLKKDGVPVDALGLQSHISAGEAADTRAWSAFLDEVTGMGYALLITEFDVDDKRLPSDIAARDRAIADYARGYLDQTLSYRQLGDVLTWGLVDRYSWLQNDPARGDHLAKRPLPYDDRYQPAPLRQAIAQAFAAAPARS
jgi:endo-1,4-beta-xylanase